MAEPRTMSLDAYLTVAGKAARTAARAIQGDFGLRVINAYKGQHDVQLRADLTAERIIYDLLKSSFPESGIVTEEGGGDWSNGQTLWAVDPLDGSNNFGYGIAHCAIAITLFIEDKAVLSFVHDPILGRSYSADGTRYPQPHHGVPPLELATVSLVTGGAEPAPGWGAQLTEWLRPKCKRIVNLWAPALDLALISHGALDAMICRDADLLDVCAGLHLVSAYGGIVRGLDGEPFELSRSMYDRPVSFVAGRNELLVKELIAATHKFTARP